VTDLVADIAQSARDFPFPLAKDAYRYTANVEPGGVSQVRVGPDYQDFIAERARVLARDPGMVISAPHLRAAEWDTMLWLMRRLALEYPADFALSEPPADGTDADAGAGAAAGARAGAGAGAARWVNRPLGIERDFTIGDAGTVPGGPLEYIGRQVVEDIVLLDPREGHLFADAGVVTFASGWSFPFVAGMTFTESHGPVPRANAAGVFARAEAFLLRLPPGEVYKRVNWTFQAGRVLDRSMDSHARWMPAAAAFIAAVKAGTVDDEVFGATTQLRVEVQHLVKLAPSGAVLFLIDTRFLSLAELASDPEWARRTASVVAELPADMADYKGLTDLRPRIVEYLSR
jgi:hypothetical protein